MQGILQDKEIRLSSRLYRVHEPKLSRRNAINANGSSQGIFGNAGKHVYSNGAEEIKAHEFFSGIPWPSMHAIAPPFIPRFRENQSITKYFEDEKDIIDSESSSLISTLAEMNDTAPEHHSQDPSPRSQYSGEKSLDTATEKEEVGMAGCPDEELKRIKEHCGPFYEQWKTCLLYTSPSPRD